MASTPSRTFCSDRLSCLLSQIFRSGASFGISPLYVIIWLPLSASAWNVCSVSLVMNEMVCACVARFWKSSHCLHRRITGGPCTATVAVASGVGAG